MRPVICHQSRPGFLLLEVIVGIAVFSLFVAAVGSTLLYGQEGTIMSGDRIRATHYTERAFEATRSIRDGSFSSVTTGAHGVWLNPTTKKWAFTGSYTGSSGGYVTSLTVSPLASDWLSLSAETKWKRGYARSGSVLITSELTDWRAAKTVGNWSSVSVDGSYTDASNPVFNDVAVYSGSYAFLTSNANNGLHIIDVSSTSAPARVNDYFTLGYPAYDAVVLGSVLYVATADSNQEIRAYDISSPSTLSSSDLIGSYNLQGAARARSLAVAGNTLYVGTSASTGIGEDEFYAFRVTSTGGITLLDSVGDDSSTFDMIAVSGTAAYLASSLDTGEMRVVDVESGSNISLLGGYNLSDRTVNGQAIYISGTSALLGTAEPSSGSISEVVLFDLRAGGIPTSPGPWYHEARDAVVGLDIDPTRCYGFIATQSGSKAFQVFNVRNKTTLAEVTTANALTGVGRGLVYEMARDRVYLITDSSLVIYRPGSSTGTCP